MGIIATITPRNTFANICSYFEKEKHYFRRNCKYWQINIDQYKPPRERCRFIYEDMIYTAAVYDFTSNVDFLWKSSWLLTLDRPGWSGLMQFCQKGEYPEKSDIVFLPVIDLNPSDLSCIYSTINFLFRHSTKYGVVPILTFDQPCGGKPCG